MEKLNEQRDLDSLQVIKYNNSTYTWELIDVKTIQEFKDKIASKKKKLVIQDAFNEGDENLLEAPFSLKEGGLFLILNFRYNRIQVGIRRPRQS